MVDCRGNTSELRKTKLLVVLKAPSNSSVSEMLNADDSDLNVMDFVETEYTPEFVEENEAVEKSDKKSKHKYGKAASKVKNLVRISDCAGKVNDHCFQSVTQSKICRTRKRSRHSSDIREPHSQTENERLYPYAACLKTLCDKVGSTQDSEPDTSCKIFNQLQHNQVHYPYASLLQELHHKIESKTASNPSTLEGYCNANGSELGIGSTMRTIQYPVTDLSDSEEHGTSVKQDSFFAPYSMCLLTFVMKQRIKQRLKQRINSNAKKSSIYEDDQSSDCQHIGEILKNCMPEVHEESPITNEMYSSALLQRLSLDVQDEEEVKDETYDKKTQDQRVECIEFNEEEFGVVMSGSEASVSEDDREWKPASWLAKTVPNSVGTKEKRKSERKKKPSSSCDYLYEATTSADDHKKSRAAVTGDDSGVNTSTLLQLILTSANNKEKILLTDTVNHCGRKRKYRKKVRKVDLRKKNKRQTEAIVGREQWEQNNLMKKLPFGRKPRHTGKNLPVSSADKTNCSTTESGLEQVLHSNEPQSLLKEYLLKPIGKEIPPEQNCSIPKVETNFLFSRLLQNFKALSEKEQCDTNPERRPENNSVSNILREMLVGRKNNNNQVKQEPCEDPNVICQTDTSSAEPFSSQCEDNNSLCDTIKCEEDIECKAEPEDSFECQVCHLQFSSVVDLSNHQVLFHCTEEPDCTSSALLAAHSADKMPTGVLQEKLPA